MVRPPSVAEALAVIEALREIDVLTLPESEAALALRRACEAWLPPALLRRLFGAADAEPVLAATDLAALLRVGIDEEEAAAHEANKEAVEEKARARSWFAVAADYADAFNMSVPQVLGMSWPLFVALAGEVDRVLARRQADFATAYLAARSGDEALFADLLRRAGYTSSGAEKPALGPEWGDPDWVEEQRRKTRAYQQKFFGKAGEA